MPFLLAYTNKDLSLDTNATLEVTIITSFEIINVITAQRLKNTVCPPSDTLKQYYFCFEVDDVSSFTINQTITLSTDQLIAIYNVNDKKTVIFDDNNRLPLGEFFQALGLAPDASYISKPLLEKRNQR